MLNGYLYSAIPMMLLHKIATLYKCMTGLTDIVYICLHGLEHTYIVLRSNLCIPIETQIITHIVRILIFLSQQIQYYKFMIYLLNKFF